MARSFYDVLGDAVNDIAEHGYDKEERIAYWSDLLRKAAKRYFTKAQTEKILRDHLQAIYRRMVINNGVTKYHKGVSKFTIAKVKPKLRAELDRRIMASANLIQLNRDEMIEKTIRRFQGWSTSVPVGGLRADTGKAQAKKDVYKALSQRPFTERRVLIDQGHKLVSSINDIVATDAGALGAIWHSNWREINYNYRPEHKQRDGVFYPIRNNWAIEKGLMKPNGHKYLDEIDQPAEKPYCRCFAQYVYNIVSVPKDMLTTKGKEVIDTVNAL